MSRLPKLVILAMALVIVGLLGLGGCAGKKPSPAIPEVKGDILVTVKSYRPGRNRPSGSYQVPNSSFVVGKYKATVWIDGVSEAVASSSGKKASIELVTGLEPAMQYNLAAEVRGILKRQIDKGHGPARLVLGASRKTQSTLVLRPWVYVGSRDGKTAQVHLFIRAHLENARGSVIWKTNYVYQMPIQLPIKGQRSWLGQDGRLLKKVVKRGYIAVGRVLLHDAHGAGARWIRKPVVMKTKIPFSDETFTLDALILQKTKTTTIYRLETKKKTLNFGVNIAANRDIDYVE